jgi:hypothetical protein
VGDNWIDHPTTWPGMRVDVEICKDLSVHKGVVDRLETLTVDGEPFLNNYPIIRLDDGREIGGIECWWTKAEDQVV